MLSTRELPLYDLPGTAARVIWSVIEVRIITKPVAGTVKVYLDSVEQLSREMGVLEPGHFEVGALEPGLIEVGVLELGPTKVGAPEPSPFEVGALEAGIGEVGALELGLAEIGAGQICHAQVGIGEERECGVREGEIAIAQVQPLDLRPVLGIPAVRADRSSSSLKLAKVRIPTAFRSFASQV